MTARLPSAGSVIRLVVALGLTAFILWKSHPALVWRMPPAPAPVPLLAAVAPRHRRSHADGVALAVAARAVRAAAGRRRPSARIGLGAVLHVFFVSSFVGTFLPASVGARRRARRRRWPGWACRWRTRSPRCSWTACSACLGILAMGVAGLWLGRADLGPAAAPPCSPRWPSTAAGCAAVAAAVFSTRVAARLIALVQRLPWARRTRPASAVVGAVQRYASHHGLLGAVTLASIGVQVLRVLQAWCLGLGLGITAPLPTYFAFIPIILLVMLLPVTVNGLGTSQAAFVLFFAAAGVGRPAAFALSVLFVALGIVGNLPGGILWTRSGLTPTPATPLADVPTPRGPA